MTPGHTWNVATGRETAYAIERHDGLLALENPALLAGGAVPGRRFVVIDDGLPEDTREDIVRYFAHHDIEAHCLVVPGGESCKKLSIAESIADEMQRWGLARRDEPLVAIGGGALLDLAGFVASIYRRGIPYVRVPTTVLAYVDASIGIKTGVNHGRWKNLLGTFSPPERVLLDPAFLRTLPTAQVSSGMGEVLKLAVVCDGELFDLLSLAPARVVEERALNPLGQTILDRAIDVMLAELGDNIYEDDLTRRVDFGHTLSPVYELQSQEAIGHGEAVAIDANLSAVIAEGRGLLSAADQSRILHTSLRLGLCRRLPAVQSADLWASVGERSAHRGGRQRIPLPRGIGECEFVDDLTRPEIDEAVRRLRHQIKQQADGPNGALADPVLTHSHGHTG